MINSDSPKAHALTLLIGVGATLALYLSGFFVILTPLPLFFVSLRYGRGVFLKVALLSLACLLPLYFFALKPLQVFYQHNPNFAWVLPIPGMGLSPSMGLESASMFGVLFYFILVLTAVSLDRIFRASSNIFEPIFTYVSVIFIVTLASYYVMVHLLGSDPLVLLQKQYLQSMDEFIKVQKDAGMSLEQLAFLTENKSTLVDSMVRLTPGFVYSFYVVLVVLNYYTAKRLFAGHLVVMQQVKFASYTIPFGFVWVVIGFLAFILFSLYVRPVPQAMDIGSNVLFVFGILYFFQGLAVLSHFLSKRPLGFLWSTLLICTILLFIQLLGPLFVLAGFFDSWIGFRSMGEKPDKKGN